MSKRKNDVAMVPVQQSAGAGPLSKRVRLDDSGNGAVMRVDNVD